MGKTYTDFSQLSKGMFKKSAPVEEIKLLPKTKTVGGDDVLSFFGLNVPETPTGASGAGSGGGGTDASLRSKPTCGLYAPNPPLSRRRRRKRNGKRAILSASWPLNGRCGRRRRPSAKGCAAR